MKDGFDRALARVLVHEGGQVDDPRDPGGRTNTGVTQRVYDAWRGRRKLPGRDVHAMEPAERDAIYRAQYWDMVKGDALPAGIDYVVFDGAVNSGPVQSAKWLQRALGTVAVDGVVGEATLAAAMSHPDLGRLVADIGTRRLAFLEALKTWPVYGRGWRRRVDEVTRTGQEWAAGAVSADPVPAPLGERRAPIADAKPPPNRAPADGATGAGIAAAAIAAAVDQLAPLTGGSALLGHLVAGLVVTGLLTTLGGLGYRLWADRKAAARRDALDLPVTS